MKVFEMFRSYNYVAYRLCSKNTVIVFFLSSDPIISIIDMTQHLMRNLREIVFKCNPPESLK